MQSLPMVVLWIIYLMVSTIKYKQAEIDLKKSMEVTFESQGAKKYDCETRGF
jgi:hypothetical protein